MKTVIFIRHGETNYNVQRLCNDSGASIQLTQKGVADAVAAGKKIKESGLYPDVVFMSDAPRVVETYLLIADSVGPVSSEFRKEITEFNNGFGGKPVSEYLEFIKGNEADAKVIGYESLRDVYDRTKLFLDEISSRPEKCILVVTHSMVLKTIKMHIENIKLDNSESVKMPGNGEIMVKTFDGKGWK